VIACGSPSSSSCAAEGKAGRESPPPRHTHPTSTPAGCGLSVACTAGASDLCRYHILALCWVRSERAQRASKPLHPASPDNSAPPVGESMQRESTAHGWDRRGRHAIGARELSPQRG